MAAAADRHQPFFIALTDNANKTNIEIQAEIFRFTTSLTRSPQLYMVSRMALLRPPSRLAQIDLSNDSFYFIKT